MARKRMSLHDYEAERQKSRAERRARKACSGATCNAQTIWPCDIEITFPVDLPWNQYFDTFGPEEPQFNNVWPCKAQVTCDFVEVAVLPPFIWGGLQGSAFTDCDPTLRSCGRWLAQRMDGHQTACDSFFDSVGVRHHPPADVRSHALLRNRYVLLRGNHRQT